jgi:hypothetical protein
MSESMYCREIEAYLCRKNDGHLIRVVGPSFERVSSWAAQGIPLKIAFRGIDRYFERYYSKGRRRRPVRVDFCEADVLDIFDDWRRALGIAAAPHGSDVGTPLGNDHAAEDAARATRRVSSLPTHLERVVLRLSETRARGTLGAEVDPVIDGIARELDRAREHARGLRGAARAALVARLADLDAELLAVAARALDEPTRKALAKDADEEIAPFRASMNGDVYARIRKAATERLVRERLGLPTVTFLQD